MALTNKHIRHGTGSVRPFLYGRLDLLDFVKQVFGGRELERNTVPGGFHVETQIGDAVIVLVAMDPPYAEATRASVYVYVDDVDAVYSRAIAAGAASLSEPVDQPYQERAAGFKDSFGNTWYVATYQGEAAK
jgi:PhnB protein